VTAEHELSEGNLAWELDKPGDWFGGCFGSPARLTQNPGRETRRPYLAIGPMAGEIGRLSNRVPP
jgi:hypothetical protein